MTPKNRSRPSSAATPPTRNAVDRVVGALAWRDGQLPHTAGDGDGPGAASSAAASSLSSSVAKSATPASVTAIPVPGGSSRRKPASTSSAPYPTARKPTYACWRSSIVPSAAPAAVERLDHDEPGRPVDAVAPEAGGRRQHRRPAVTSPLQGGPTIGVAAVVVADRRADDAFGQHRIDDRLVLGRRGGGDERASWPPLQDRDLGGLERSAVVTVDEESERHPARALDPGSVRLEGSAIHDPLLIDEGAAAGEGAHGPADHRLERCRRLVGQGLGDGLRLVALLVPSNTYL